MTRDDTILDAEASNDLRWNANCTMGFAKGTMTAVRDTVSVIASRRPCCTQSRKAARFSTSVRREKIGSSESKTGLERIPNGAITSKLAYPSAAAAPGMNEAK